MIAARSTPSKAAANASWTPESCRGGFRGFTLVEVVVVVAIVGILSTIAIPLYKGYIDKARTIRSIAEIRDIAKVVNLYRKESEVTPKLLSDIGCEKMRDPWGNLYRYLDLTDAKKGKMRKDRFLVPINTHFDLYSMGKDGKSATPLTAKSSRDDIVWANDGEFVGLAINY